MNQDIGAQAEFPVEAHASGRTEPGEAEPESSARSAQHRAPSGNSAPDNAATLEQQLREARKQLANRVSDLQREQATRRHLEKEHDQLRYKIVDALNDLAKKVPWVWKPAKAVFSRSVKTPAANVEFPARRNGVHGGAGSAVELREPLANRRPPADETAAEAHSGAALGVNLAGHLNSEKGVGEAVRIGMRSLEAAGIPYALTNFHDPESQNLEDDIPEVLAGNPYGINLVHVSMDLVPAFARRNDSYFTDRYNIGCWNWELSTLPPELRGSFCYFNEIWVPSNHTLDAVSRVSPVPVVRMPYAVKQDPAPDKSWTRARFGMKDDAFVFLFLFDFLSHMERKNPLGLVRAFQRAFTPRDNAVLFIKCAHSDDAKPSLALLQRACHRADIRLFDSVLPREGLDALMSRCDAYVSLHRSEGFGLTLTEAMSMGKPVIATAYSSNLDFMTPGNSFLVKYKLAEIERDHGPYKRGAVWADPDLDHAAELMRFVYEHRDEAAAVARQGRADVQRDLHPKVVGRMMRERLCQISSGLHP